MEPTAPRRLVILTEGGFGPHHAKTAWGVIRYGRDEIVAILDSTIAGRNANEWLPGHDIPAVATLDEALAIPGRPRPDTLLIGIAPTGGLLPNAWRTILLDAIRAGLELHSGLHTLLGDDPEIAAAVAAAAISGSAPRSVWSPEWSSRPARIASRRIVRHALGRRPPVGAMPMRSVSGRGRPGIASASSSVATAGMSWPGNHSFALRPAMVESRMATISSRP